jgi:hypothetical protein
VWAPPSTNSTRTSPCSLPCARLVPILSPSSHVRRCTSRSPSSSGSAGFLLYFSFRAFQRKDVLNFQLVSRDRSKRQWPRSRCASVPKSSGHHLSSREVEAQGSGATQRSFICSGVANKLYSLVRYRITGDARWLMVCRREQEPVETGCLCLRMVSASTTNSETQTILAVD